VSLQALRTLKHGDDDGNILELLEERELNFPARQGRSGGRRFPEGRIHQ